MENAKFNNNNNNTDGEEAPFEFKNLLSEMFTSFPNQNPNTFFSSPNNSSTSTNSSSSPPQNIISFGNNNHPAEYSNYLDQDNEDYTYDKVLMMTSNISTSSTTTAAKRITRSPLQSQHHNLAERKRRERFSQLFAVLAKAIPGLKKLDKASILEDAIKYIGELQERVVALEEAAGAKSSRNYLIESTTATAQKQHSLATTSSHDGNSFMNIVDHESKWSHENHDIKVQILEKNVLIGIHCSKEMRSIFSIIAGIMEKLHLTIHHIRVTPSNHSTALHYISILAEIDENVDIKVQDVEKAFQLPLLSTPNLTQD